MPISSHTFSQLEKEQAEFQRRCGLRAVAGRCGRGKQGAPTCLLRTQASSALLRKRATNGNGSNQQNRRRQSVELMKGSEGNGHETTADICSDH